MTRSAEDEFRASERAGAPRLYDADGKLTTDPSHAVRGEIIEHDEHGRASRRTWFLIERVEIRWLPMSESAFLLWVLALLVGVWVGVAAWLRIF